VEADKMDLFSFALFGILATLGTAEGNATQCFFKITICHPTFPWFYNGDTTIAYTPVIRQPWSVLTQKDSNIRSL
jgi:hypothetical protein